MTKEELEALLIEVDMPRAIEADLWEDEIKLSIVLADPKDPIKVASCYGKIIGNIEHASLPDIMGLFAQDSRKLIEEQRKAGLVPYYSIPSNCTQAQ